jgi:hypothetical protein
MPPRDSGGGHFVRACPLIRPSARPWAVAAAMACQLAGAVRLPAGDQAGLAPRPIPRRVQGRPVPVRGRAARSGRPIPRGRRSRRRRAVPGEGDARPRLPGRAVGASRSPGSARPRRGRRPPGAGTPRPDGPETSRSGSSTCSARPTSLSLGFSVQAVKMIEFSDQARWEPQPPVPFLPGPASVSARVERPGGAAIRR